MINSIRTLESSAHLYHWERVSLKETSNLGNHTISTDVNNEEKSTKGLAIETVKYIFYLLFSGLIFAATVLICEMIVIKFNLNLIKKKIF